jgi:amphi-Trp domain-containing protein
VVSLPSRFRGRARRDAAAFYLSQLARGILAGELGVQVWHETVAVEPADFLVLEVAVTQKIHVHQISVRVRWSRRPAAIPQRPARSRGTPGPDRRAPGVT